MAANTAVNRIIEPGVTVFTAAAIQVAVLPIGPIPEDILYQYLSLITRFRQVDLTNVRSFYKEQQKSPFKYFPWKTGSMHFRFLSGESASKPRPLAALHLHRKVLGVIGICHCPLVPDINKAYSRFEQMCRQFPEAFTLRCFAFEPSDAQVDEDRKDKAHLMMFPPVRGAGGMDQLAGHAEVVMTDTAASLLAELERWMLNASPAMLNLNSFADTSDKFIIPSSLVEDLSKRLYNDEELLRKKRYGRLQKAMGDTSLLAGSPADAIEHYNTATELARICNDFVWCAAALEGLAHAKVLESCVASGALRSGKVGGEESPPRNPRIASLMAEDASSLASRTSSGFGGAHFWTALRQTDLERDVRALFAEAKSVVRRKGALPMQVEQDLKLARFLAGLHGQRSRREVSEIVSSMMEAVGQLPLLEDKLLTMMEGAQVMGLVGSARKRVLLLWQAVEFSRASERPNIATLQIARKALEPADDPLEQDDEDEVLQRRHELASGVPRHWASVRCGCMEGVLNTAILAGQHSDVWDAAALLLREHCWDLSAPRQDSLMSTLAAAANQMGMAERKRMGPGPPPLFTFLRPCPLPDHLQPHSLSARQPAKQAPEGPKDPFIYSAFTSKGREREVANTTAVQWVCDETASVEVEICNPTSVGIKIDRLSLEAQHVGDPAVAQRDHNSSSQPSWRPAPVQMWLPAQTQPTKVVLTGVPLVKGLFVIQGCRVTSLGVSWLQRWSARIPSLGRRLLYHPAKTVLELEAADSGGQAQARISAVATLPQLEVKVEGARTATSLRPAAAADSPNAVSIPVSLSSSSQVGAGSADPASETSAAPLTALKGQVLLWHLAVTNTGKLTVDQAMLTADATAAGRTGTAGRGVRGAEAGGSSRPAPTSMLVRPGSGLLQAALPLLPGARTSVPVLLHAAQLASYTGEDEHKLEFRLEYAGGGAAVAGEAAAVAGTLGRRLQVALQLRVLPSLQLTSVAFLEHQLPHTAPSGEAGAIERQCILEVDVVNRTDLGLEVWLAPRVPPELGSDAWAQAASGPPPSAWPPGTQPLHAMAKQAPARQRVSLAALLSLPHITPETIKIPAQQHADAVRQACAAEICGRMAVYWRRNDPADPGGQAEVGVLPLAQDSVARALTRQALSLLCPCTLHTSFKLQVVQPDGARQVCPLSPVQQVGSTLLDGAVARTALQGVRAHPGQPVEATVQIENRGPHVQTGAMSLACQRCRPAASSEAAAGDEHVVVCGSTSGVRVVLPAGGTVQHSLVLCFLGTGLYQVSVSNIEFEAPTSGPGQPHSTPLHVHPLASLAGAHVLVA